ncbi:hypothetical protein RHGRI_026471 [Rhododendron griersonianum]|uniref:Uncharacterized protein n=1 Tax=Rhododendron griersonianum TaxID=479676 RepID=A0AAV6IYB3_9ERIC|nr:hypothetical protein RHGRI_026471 [Rhododendron griersonianum]
MKAATTAMMTITATIRTKTTAMKKATKKKHSRLLVLEQRSLRFQRTVRSITVRSSGFSRCSTGVFYCLFLVCDLAPGREDLPHRPPANKMSACCMVIDGIIYHSFLWYSEEGVDHCWSLSYVDPLDVPQVVGRRFGNGWSTFRKLHGLKTEYKFVLAVERKWIFHGVFLNQNDREMVFDWTGPNLQWRDLHPPLRNLCTSCSHSVVSAAQSVLKFGHLHLLGRQLRHEFELRRKEVFWVYDREEMVIRMGNRAWAVPIDDLHLDAQRFAHFIGVLQLEFPDYLGGYHATHCKTPSCCDMRRCGC